MKPIDKDHQGNECAATTPHNAWCSRIFKKISFYLTMQLIINSYKNKYPNATLTG